MKIELHFRLKDNRLVAVPPPGERLAEADLQQLKSMYYLAGELTLQHEGQPTLQIADNLEHLVPWLCIWPLTALRLGQPATVTLATDPAKLILTPTDGVIKAEGSWGESAEYPQAELLEQLEATGRRYVVFLHEHFADDAVRQEQMNDLAFTLKLKLDSPHQSDDGGDPYEVSPEEVERIIAENQAGIGVEESGDE